MINLSDSRITDLLPANLASDTEMQAFSYAVGRQIEKLCAYADACRSYAVIGSLGDDMLDILAVELRTPAYSESYSTVVKRTLVKNTLPFYMTLGTPSAVAGVVDAIFGGGVVVEWFEYEGLPHHYRVQTESRYSAEIVNELKQALAAVKRRSSILDRVEFIAYSAEATAYASAAMIGTELVEYGTAVND